MGMNGIRDPVVHALNMIVQRRKTIESFLRIRDHGILRGLKRKRETIA